MSPESWAAENGDRPLRATMFHASGLNVIDAREMSSEDLLRSTQCETSEMATMVGVADVARRCRVRYVASAGNKRSTVKGGDKSKDQEIRKALR